jgi:hypothetical protein
MVNTAPFQALPPTRHLPYAQHGLHGTGPLTRGLAPARCLMIRPPLRIYGSPSCAIRERNPGPAPQIRGRSGPAAGVLFPRHVNRAFVRYPTTSRGSQHAEWPPQAQIQSHSQLETLGQCKGAPGANASGRAFVSVRECPTVNLADGAFGARTSHIKGSPSPGGSWVQHDLEKARCSNPVPGSYRMAKPRRISRIPYRAFSGEVQIFWRRLRLSPVNWGACHRSQSLGKLLPCPRRSLMELIRPPSVLTSRSPFVFRMIRDMSNGGTDAKPSYVACPDHRPATPSTRIAIEWSQPRSLHPAKPPSTVLGHGHLYDCGLRLPWFLELRAHRGSRATGIAIGHARRYSARHGRGFRGLTPYPFASA